MTDLERDAELMAMAVRYDQSRAGPPSVCSSAVP